METVNIAALKLLLYFLGADERELSSNVIVAVIDSTYEASDIVQYIRHHI